MTTNTIPWEVSDAWGRLREVPRRLWRGHFSLPVAYWGCWVLGGLIVSKGYDGLSAVFTALEETGRISAATTLTVTVVGIAVCLAYWLTAAIGTWRSATRDPRGHWGGVAQVMIVIGSALGFAAGYAQESRETERHEQRVATAYGAAATSISAHDATILERIAEPVDRWGTIVEAIANGYGDDAVSGEQWISDTTPQLMALAVTLRDFDKLVQELNDPGVRQTMTAIQDAYGAELAGIRATFEAVARSDVAGQTATIEQWTAAETARRQLWYQVVKAVDTHGAVLSAISQRPS
ncbi:MAG: hypothetical protein GEV06_09335 [Luteitalea sp.]|nr:hypothetical protein [Luteitalea sp.]